MVIHPAGLIAALHDRVPALMPAHAAYGVATAQMSDEAASAPGCGHYLYVQGRGDRIHAFLCVDELESAPLDGFSRCDANWRWLATWAEDVDAELLDAARRHGLGVIGVPRTGALVRHVEAPPNPGIFIKRYPALRAHWRTLSDW